jgi:hypothetical protein
MNEDLLRRMREARELKASLSAGEPGKVLVEEEYDDDILPFELYRKTRQNIERIADQINKSFHFEIYDGTAVLMRRLIEMLLILAFKQIGEEDCIRGSEGNYLPLSDIVNCAVQNRHLDLSRNAKGYLGIFKEAGDLSAHNPFHNCRKKDLELVRHKFRSLVEELLYKGGILV